MFICFVAERMLGTYSKDTKRKRAKLNLGKKNFKKPSYTVNATILYLLCLVFTC